MDQDAPPPLISSLPDADCIGPPLAADWQPPPGDLAWQQRAAERSALLLRKSIKAVASRVAPEGGLKRHCIDLLHDFTGDMMGIFITAASLNAFTLTPATIELAVDAVLKGELARLAKSEGAQAVAKWTASFAAPQYSARGVLGWSKRAGLIFSIDLVQSTMRATHVRLNHCAPIFLAAVLELLLTKTLRLAGLQRAARISKHPALPPTPISVRDIFQALLADDELRHLLLPLPLPATEE